VTLYQEQWLKLLDMADDIRSFIKGGTRAEHGRADPTPTSRTFGSSSGGRWSSRSGRSMVAVLNSRLTTQSAEALKQKVSA